MALLVAVIAKLVKINMHWILCFLLQFKKKFKLYFKELVFSGFHTFIKPNQTLEFM